MEVHSPEHVLSRIKAWCFKDLFRSRALSCFARTSSSCTCSAFTAASDVDRDIDEESPPPPDSDENEDEGPEDAEEEEGLRPVESARPGDCDLALAVAEKAEEGDAPARERVELTPLGVEGPETPARVVVAVAEEGAEVAV